MKQIRATSIGAAGAARAEIAAKLQKIFIDLSLTNVEIVGDSVIALEAAFGSGPGVMAIAGTGSIVYGRDASGRFARAGGWGFAVSDEGSGHWIGRRALSAVFNAHDTGRETLLKSFTLKSCNLRSLDELVQFANSTPPPEFPRLFPVVLRAAEQGDLLAQELLALAGVELGALVAVVIRKLSQQKAEDAGGIGAVDVTQEGTTLLPVATTGSVFRQSVQVREAFSAALRQQFERIEIRQDIAEPIHGAVARARAMRLNAV